MDFIRERLTSLSSGTIEAEELPKDKNSLIGFLVRNIIPITFVAGGVVFYAFSKRPKCLENGNVNTGNRASEARMAENEERISNLETTRRRQNAIDESEIEEVSRRIEQKRTQSEERVTRYLEQNRQEMEERERTRTAENKQYHVRVRTTLDANERAHEELRNQQRSVRDDEESELEDEPDFVTITRIRTMVASSSSSKLNALILQQLY